MFSASKHIKPLAKGGNESLLITGPTGSGKSHLALESARKLGGEIISIDSCSVFRDFDIGTAKPTIDLRREIPHHLIDIRMPTERYSAGEFHVDAHKCVQDILSRGKTPILCGGTMMYINTLVRGLNKMPKISEAIHRRVKDEVRKKGSFLAHARLMKVDPRSADKLSPNDSQRIVRALEVYDATSRPLSSWVSPPAIKASFKMTRCFLVPKNRKDLAKSLKQRFLAMIESGFVEEVAMIIKKYGTDLDPLRSVGYRQIADHVLGIETLDRAVEKGIVATRQLAKRQMTWIRKFKPDDSEVLEV